MPRPDDRARLPLRFAPAQPLVTQESMLPARPRPLPGTQPLPSRLNAARPDMLRSAAGKTRNCRALPLVPTGPPAARLLPGTARLPEVLQCDPDCSSLGQTAPMVQVSIHVSGRFPAIMKSHGALLTADHQIADFRHVFHRKADAFTAQPRIFHAAIRHVVNAVA